MSSDIPTPRTDAARPPFIELQDFVPVSFARTLERELAEQCELNGKGAEREYVLLGKLTRAEAELAAARANFNEEHGQRCQLQCVCADLQNDNAALRAELNAAEETITAIDAVNVNEHGFTADFAIHRLIVTHRQARAALAGWKEATT